MIQDEVNKFFANKPNPPTRMSLNGKKLSVSNLSKEDQEKIKQRLIEKDPILQKGHEGILPGILIDGKQVTRENIKDFEIKPKKEKLEEKVEPKSSGEKVVEPKKVEPNKVEVKKEVKKVEKKTTKKK